MSDEPKTGVVIGEQTKWGTPKQWAAWILFCGVIPTMAYLAFARRMLHAELEFYLIGTPPLLLYFWLLGRLGLGVPGTMREGSPDDSVGNLLGFVIRAGHPVGKVMVWLRTYTVAFVMPSFGTGLIYYAVRDGEVVGYFLGPAMIWVSGGMWALTMRFLAAVRENRRSESGLQQWP